VSSPLDPQAFARSLPPPALPGALPGPDHDRDSPDVFAAVDQLFGELFDRLEAVEARPSLRDEFEGFKALIGAELAELRAAWIPADRELAERVSRLEAAAARPVVRIITPERDPASNRIVRLISTETPET
jgi:hypothetical protein